MASKSVRIDGDASPLVTRETQRGLTSISMGDFDGVRPKVFYDTDLVVDGSPAARRSRDRDVDAGMPLTAPSADQAPKIAMPVSGPTRGVNFRSDAAPIRRPDAVPIRKADESDDEPLGHMEIHITSIGLDVLPDAPRKYDGDRHKQDVLRSFRSYAAGTDAELAESDDILVLDGRGLKVMPAAACLHRPSFRDSLREVGTDDEFHNLAKIALKYIHNIQDSSMARILLFDATDGFRASSAAYLLETFLYELGATLLFTHLRSDSPTGKRCGTACKKCIVDGDRSYMEIDMALAPLDDIWNDIIADAEERLRKLDARSKAAARTSGSAASKTPRSSTGASAKTKVKTEDQDKKRRREDRSRSDRHRDSVPERECRDPRGRPRDGGGRSSRRRSPSDSRARDLRGRADLRPREPSEPRPRAPSEPPSRDVQDRHDQRDPEVLEMLGQSFREPRIDDARLNYEPLTWRDEEFDDVFIGRRRSFVTYLGGSPRDPSSTKLRVNAKIAPTCTEIKHPVEWTGWKKTSVVQDRPGDSWRVVEDRVDIDYVTRLPQGTHRCLVFAQPPRQLQDGRIYACAKRNGHQFDIPDTAGTIPNRDAHGDKKDGIGITNDGIRTARVPTESAVTIPCRDVPGDSSIARDRRTAMNARQRRTFNAAIRAAQTEDATLLKALGVADAVAPSTASDAAPGAEILFLSDEVIGLRFDECFIAL
jgi:hypothetical protein